MSNGIFADKEVACSEGVGGLVRPVVAVTIRNDPVSRAVAVSSFQGGHSSDLRGVHPAALSGVLRSRELVIGY